MAAMDRPALLRTGTFARASSLSVKALRVYHEMGLLVPSVVDPDTGYRAYAPAQLNDAAIIRLLRDAGAPLQDIRAVLDARDLDLVRKVLAEQAARLQAGLDAVAQLVDDLSVDDTETEGVVVRFEAARHVLAIDGNPRLADLAPFALHAEATLHACAAASLAVVDGSFGAAWPVQVDDDHQAVTTYVPIAEPVLVESSYRELGVRIYELPAGDVAVLVHRGPYLGLEAAYRRLGTWVAFHAVPADLPVREWYVTPLEGPEDDAVTEVLWPVVASDPSG
jgi:DNA-binding transcriptional MerR regulator